MALTSITKDFVTKGGVLIEATNVVTSSTSQTGALQVNSGAAIAQNLIVGTTATIWGIAQLNAGATANGPVTINSTLNVTGQTTLGQTSAATFTATSLTVTGNGAIGGAFSVTGQTTLGQTNAGTFTATSVTVNGSETISGGLSVSGQTVLGQVTATIFTATSINVSGNETISGGLSVSGQTVLGQVTATIFTATSLTVSGTAGIGGIVTISNTTAATSTGTGALQVAGGGSFGGNLYVGGGAYVTGDLYVDGTQFIVNKQTIGTGDLILALATGTANASLATGAGLYIGSTSSSAAYITWSFDGGTGAAGNWVSSGGIKVNSTASNTVGSASSGALQVVGGAGIGGNLTVGGTVSAANIVGTIGSASSQIGGGTNLYGGLQGQLVYQSGPNTTAFLTTGTNGQILYMQGGLPVWIAPTGLSAGNSNTATNIAGGLTNQIPYQSAPGNTVFNSGLTYNGSLFSTTNIIVSSNVNSTSSTTGALTVVGGVGISQDLWVGGNINLFGNLYLKGIGLDQITGSTGTFVNLVVSGTSPNAISVPSGGITTLGLTATTATVTSTNFSTSTIAGNALQVTGGIGAGSLYVSGTSAINGNLYVTGNISGTNVTQLTVNNGIFYGVPYGFGALYAGITGYTVLPSTVFQSTSNTSTYAQNNFQNLSTSSIATTDWVATAGDGNDTTNYIDMGITTGNWNGTQQNSLGTALVGNDGYLYVQGGTTGRGNLVIGASATATSVKILAGGIGSGSIAMVVGSPLQPAASATSATVVIYGGIGATSAYINGIVTSTSHIITGTAPAGSTANTGALQVAGGASIGAGLYVIGSTTSSGSIQMGSGASGLLLTPNGSAGAIYSTGVTPGTTNYALSTNGTNTYINGTTNVQLAVGNTTGLTVQTGTGSTTAATGQSVVVAANGIGVTGASYFANAVGFGANVSVAGVTTITNTTIVSSTTTGALQVAGGVGIGGSLYVGGVVTATTFYGNLTGNVTGNLTGTATLATTATNLAGGAAGSIHIQSGAGTTAFIPIGTSGFVLTAGTNTATWQAMSGLAAGSATTATNIANGAQYQIPFQSSAGTTTFSSNLTFNNTTNVLNAANLTIAGVTTSTGQLVANSGVASQGTNTGALVVSGGVGITGSVNVGGTVTAAVPAIANASTPTFIGGNTTFAYFTSNTITGTGSVNLDVWSTSTYRTARYMIQIVDSPKVHIAEMTVFMDPLTSIYMNQYGISTNQGELGAFDANLTSNPGSLTLTFTPSPAASAMVIKLTRMSITS